MNVFESIADRRITEAREAGFFDDLPGRGRPIADLDRERPSGWWPARVARQERSQLRAEELEATIRAAMPAIWRSSDEDEVRHRVRSLNALIAAENRITVLDHRDPLDLDATVARWHDFRRRPPLD